MKRLLGAVLSAFVTICGASAADTATGDCPRWAKAQTVLNATFADAKTQGIRAVRGHISDLEAALADMDKPCPAPTDGSTVVLTDGMMESLFMLAAAGKEHPGKKVIAVGNPYPLIAVFLGSYYNEVRRYEDALRVLDRERSFDKGNTGETRPGLTSERAVALGQLRRLDEALAAYDEGLTLVGISDKDKARMHRGRGYIFTERDQLDEAEAAYRESLKLDPDNYGAKHELEYIYKLRLGGKKAPSGALPTLPAPKTN